jgi:hypothetical protein
VGYNLETGTIFGDLEPKEPEEPEEGLEGLKVNLSSAHKTPSN